jgi:site-specific recombinase XerD
MTPTIRSVAISICGSGRSPSRGKNGKARIVKIGYHTARTVDRYLRARARHAQAWRPQL